VSFIASKEVILFCRSSRAAVSVAQNRKSEAGKEIEKIERKKETLLKLFLGLSYL